MTDLNKELGIEIKIPDPLKRQVWDLAELDTVQDRTLIDEEAHGGSWFKEDRNGAARDQYGLEEKNLTR